MLRKIIFFRVSQLVWLTLCTLSFITYSYRILQMQSDAEHGVLFVLQMLVLTFPIGYPANLLSVGAIEILSSFGVVVSAIQDVALQWVFMVVFGYFQWFVLVPKFLVSIKGNIDSRTRTQKRKMRQKAAVKIDPLTGAVRTNNYGRPALTNSKSKVDY